MDNITRLVIAGADSLLRVRVAATWASRAIGLLATERLDDPCGLWIKPCRSIHTCWMRYSIDVVFIDGDGRVTKIVPELRPWHMAACRRGRSTLELRAGLARRLGLQPGILLQFH